MNETTQLSSKRSYSFFNVILILIILLSLNRTNVASALSIRWVEVSKTLEGIQYIDGNSLTTKDKGEIEITTKYLKLDANTSKEIEENIYTTRINCTSNRYKDISVNGKNILSAKWLDPNEDKLIIDVISETCKNAKNYKLREI